MKNYTCARAFQAALIGIAMIGSATLARADIKDCEFQLAGQTVNKADTATRASGISRLVAIAENLNPTVAAASFDFSAALHMVGAAGVPGDPKLVLEAWDVNSLGAGKRRNGGSL